jgi:hypothetical protein
VVKPFMPIVKWFGVALYAAVLVLAPFNHHDLICHFKTPQHCTACTSNQLGTDPATLGAPPFHPLTDAGRALQTQALAEGVLLATDSTGRSPPSSL